MPPIIKETDAAAASESGAARDKIQVAQQTVALEVPVLVNGGRAIEGSDQREPFSESTKTVLVHGNGAIIRLNSPVAPGQLLFLTNERTKKEVVCQVVKSKSHGDVSGYVELQFTEAVAGFWGMRFPGERSGAQPRAATPISTVAPSIEAELEPLSAAPTPAEMAKAQRVMEAKKDASQFTGLVTGETSKPVPFTAELKSDERGATKADFFESAASTSAAALERDPSQLREEPSSAPVSVAPPKSEDQPSSEVKDQEFAGAAAKLFEMAQANSAPAKAASSSDSVEASPKPKALAEESSLKVEAVKVPAWLVNPASAPDQGKADAPRLEKAQNSELEKPAASSLVRTPRRSEPSARVFSKALLDDTPQALEPRALSGTNKGVWILGAAAVVVFSAAGVTWYLRQPIQPEAPRNPLSAATVPIASASTAAPVVTAASATGVPATQTSASMETPSIETKASSVATSDHPLAAVQVSAQPAIVSERVAKPPMDSVATASSPSAPAGDAGPVSSRPSLGKVRLAKPKKVTGAHVGSDDIAEPAIDLNNPNTPAGESLGSGLLNSSDAPTRPVGGDAVPARMISSVPPVYPQAARAQHISGEVSVDALIDVKGRVSSTKVISGPALLHQAAKDALRQWKYQPATLNGTPVPMHLTVTIQFRLE
jgi:TonB family protein